MPRLNLVQRVRVGAGFVAASARLAGAKSKPRVIVRLDSTNQLRLDSTNMRLDRSPTQHLLGVC
ncbi:hypothetical protein DSI35_07795 [Mycobacterium tuberculosis]|uniref:Uncharacterized protein n=3 Tax=Mycobacterium tuberculosis complex TaxID=77643 RepID=A0AB73YKA7_MYCTX|nr:hypothetical protein BTU11_10205 [Mycobacterium tuberculosis]AVK90086.1 hypothetical protein C1D11_10250 [Mycobacterium tuberculosis variant bovis]AYP12226.1 hypothetical protein EBQ37_10640 [Mycobacterium tuberculosis variant bovis BCG]ORT90220.1 hypothetical protein BS299_08435 [Mycobacterium tuberculosis M13]PRH93001.1 hypothetical protein B8A26_04110 [Mycobacterium tuberculosis variant pinnipedii]PRH96763.1 hypothetical protein B8A28_10660 [Mycobacterium tuberculosis variant caprae]PRH